MTRIAFFDTFNGDGAAEQEVSRRIEYCCQKENIDFVRLKNNCINFDNGQFADNMDIDFFYAHEVVSTASKVLPDTFGIFFHWAPLGFNGEYWTNKYIQYMNKFDIIAGGYETEDAKYDCINNQCLPKDGLYNITSSVPSDFAIKPQRLDKRKLFYIGINLERNIPGGGGRYSPLINYCNDNNLIDLYGPNASFNSKGHWNGYKCYKGSIPLDGYTVIKAISKAGICLALNSPSHNAIGSVSNRIYEGACAGAVIISDDNPYVRKYFGDSVFYIDVRADETKQIEQIKEILEYINKNPDIVYDMACKSQKVFLEKLALDNQVKGLIPYIEEQKRTMTDLSLQQETVDVICFVDNKEDWYLIKAEIEKQYYKNIHPIIVTFDEELKALSDIDIIEANQHRGKVFKKAIKLLKGEYFIILDKFSVIHKNHIYKCVKTLKDCGELFCYSGTYLKHFDKTNMPYSYETLNHEPLTKANILAFLNPYNSAYISLKLEQETPSCSFLFKRKILEYIKDIELEQISLNLPMYFVCCSLLKARKNGQFTYALTSGFRLNDGQSFSYDIMKHNKIFYDCLKYQNTFMKELISIFSLYNVEIPLNKEVNKQFWKIIKIKKMLNRHPHLKDILEKRHKLPKNYNDVIYFAKYLKKNKKLYKKLRLLNSILK